MKELYNELSGSQMLIGVEHVMGIGSPQAYEILESEKLPMKCKSLMRNTSNVSKKTFLECRLCKKKFGIRPKPIEDGFDKKISFLWQNRKKIFSRCCTSIRWNNAHWNRSQQESWKNPLEIFFCIFYFYIKFYNPLSHRNSSWYIENNPKHSKRF